MDIDVDTDVDVDADDSKRELDGPRRACRNSSSVPPVFPIPASLLVLILLLTLVMLLACCIMHGAPWACECVMMSVCTGS